MSDSQKPNAKAIPSWQRQEPSDPSQKSPETTVDISNEPTSEEPPPSRAALVDQALKFLENDEIQNAPEERKISFLQAKGLNPEEIVRLLANPRKEDKPEELVIEQREKQQPYNSSITPKRSPPPPSPSRDQPPIITYPEFLIHSQKPPPLITLSRLLTALYIASGTAATIYATDKYIVAPMLESLTLARHSLFSSTTANLDTLNEKLEQAVSTIPGHTTRQRKSLDDSDNSSTISDPTEFFHRDIATQTSTPPSSALSDSISSLPLNSINTQHTYLQTLHSHLSSLLVSTETLESDDVLEDRLSGFGTFIEGLSFPSSREMNGYGGLPGKEDEITRVKAEIRGVKGVLLSARNFPAGAVTGSR